MIFGNIDHLKEYVEKEDFLPMEGGKNGSVILRPGVKFRWKMRSNP